MQCGAVRPLKRLSELSDAFAADVVRGLSARPRSIPSKYLYDARGSELFDEISRLPEYYLTRSEERLLATVAPAIARETHGVEELLELGCGTARKTGRLLEGFLRRGRDLRYVPLDVSEEALSRACEALSLELPHLRSAPVLCDYTRDLGLVRPRVPCLVAFLGSTIGNFDEVEERAFLTAVSDMLAPGDWLLLGFDLVKPARVLEAAYNDSRGVTAMFTMNLLVRMNRELGATFDPRRFAHLAVYNAQAARIEIYLSSLAEQEVRFRALDLAVRFEHGERVRTEISRKYTREGVESALEGAGFEMQRWFESKDRYFALALARNAG